MSQLLRYLPILACPIGMGLMMWMMMPRGRSEPAQPPLHGSPAMTPAQEAELTALRAELDQLRAEDRDSDARR